MDACFRLGFAEEEREEEEQGGVRPVVRSPSLFSCFLLRLFSSHHNARSFGEKRSAVWLAGSTRIV